MEDIPISAAKYIAEKYDYDQVVIIARKIGDDGGEHVTTYGKDKENCSVATRIGKFLKREVMFWIECNKKPPGEQEYKRIEKARKNLCWCDAGPMQSKTKPHKEGVKGCKHALPYKT